MTDAGEHAAPAAHAPTDDGAAHDIHGVGHGARGAPDGEEALGPIDVQAWMAGVLGVAIGLLTAACFVLATAGTGAY